MIHVMDVLFVMCMSKNEPLIFIGFKDMIVYIKPVGVLRCF